MEYLSSMYSGWLHLGEYVPSEWREWISSYASTEPTENPTRSFKPFANPVEMALESLRTISRRELTFLVIFQTSSEKLKIHEPYLKKFKVLESRKGVNQNPMMVLRGSCRDIQSWLEEMSSQSEEHYISAINFYL